MAHVTSGAVSLLGLDPARYEPHELHRGERSFTETNCYVDLFIEFLHALDLEPMAMLGCTMAVDFEGDQWTFFKPPAADLERLYGIDLQELAVYRPLAAHAVEQLERGNTVAAEVDAYWLPDTAGTSYRQAHVKTSIAIEAIDREACRLRYFHNAGLYELEGEDYRFALRDGVELSADVLPPYVELVRLQRLRRRSVEELRSEAWALLAEHLARRPPMNPVRLFGERLAADLPALLTATAQDYHDYAFATLRQCGAAFETGAAHLRWLRPSGELEAPAAALEELAGGAKLLTFRLARATASGRPFEPATIIDSMGTAWERAHAELDAAVANRV